MKAALLFQNPDKASPYRDALALAGLTAAPFTPGSTATLDEVGGIVLSGGTDVDPALYGAAPHLQTEPPDHERDAYEAAILREALSRDMPILAICRGMQLLNVVCGGTLLQHIENHRLVTHEAIFEPPSQSIFGVARTTVNSRHHQALDRIGHGLAVTARSPDGIVEGAQLTDRTFVVAVQWHPEDLMDDPVQRRLFAAFRNAF